LPLPGNVNRFNCNAKKKTVEKKLLRIINSIIFTWAFLT